MPEFPFRFVEQIRDFVAPSVPRLEGFDANDLNNILIPDVINANNAYVTLIGMALLIAFLSWDRQHHHHHHHDHHHPRDGRREHHTPAGHFEDDENSGEVIVSGSRKGGEPASNRPTSTLPTRTLGARGTMGPSSARLLFDQDVPEQVKNSLVRRERRRGLAWLALLTAITVWCTGIVNVEHPFQP